MTKISILTGALVAFSLLAAPMAASAQETTPIAAENVTNEQVEAFVRVAIALEALRAEYTTKIGNAETEEAQNELRAEADRVAIQLVDKAKGITPDEYLAISKAVQDSEDLATRIGAQVEVMREQKAAFEAQQAEAAKAREAQKAAEALEAAETTTAETAAEDAASE